MIAAYLAGCLAYPLLLFAADSGSRDALKNLPDSSIEIRITQADMSEGAIQDALGLVQDKLKEAPELADYSRPYNNHHLMVAQGALKSKLKYRRLGDKK